MGGSASVMGAPAVNLPRGTYRDHVKCMKKATLIAAARIATGNPRLGWGGAKKWAQKRMRDLRRQIAAAQDVVHQNAPDRTEMVQAA